MFEITNSRFYLFAVVFLLLIVFSPEVKKDVTIILESEEIESEEIESEKIESEKIESEVVIEEYVISTEEAVEVFEVILVEVVAEVEVEVEAEVEIAQEQETLNYVNESDLSILSHVIYAEASVDGWEGMTAVAEVIMNRMHDGRYPDTIEEIVYQEHNGIYQFCVVRNGRIDLEPNDLARQIAREVLERSDNILLDEKVLFFCMETTKNSFMQSRKLATNIGTQNFYY